MLRTLRLRAGLSQQELARLSGISQRGLRKIESQSTRPRATTVRLLAEALRLDDEQRDALFDAALPEVPDRPVPAVKPAQLPATTAAFLGRDEAVAAIVAAAATRRVLVVDGMAGIGKTTLATYCARRFEDRYPDGHLFIDLHGFHADIPPMSAPAALDRMLRDLGVAAERIPHDLDARAALYRSTLAGRRLVIVLDNAATEAQVRPLLPGDPGNLVLVTSRNKLPGLDDAWYLSLATLAESDAVELFRRVADRADDGDAVAEIVERCGRLPLAIRIAASRLSNRPHWTPQWLLDRLRSADSPLAELSRDHGGVAVAVELSYTDLDAESARFLRALGAGFGTDFDAHAAAALAGIATTRAEALLEQLLDANLVLAAETPGRFRFHDLIRQFADDKARAEATEADREAMRTRLLDRYRATAQRAAKTLNPHFTLEYAPTDDAELPPVDTMARAQRWFDAEHHNLILAVDHAFAHRDDEHVLNLTFALWAYLDRGDRHTEQEHVYRHAVTAAQRSGDEAAHARALNLLGLTLPRLGDTTGGMRSLELSLQIRRRIDDHNGVAATLNNLAQAVARIGGLGEAIRLYRECAAVADANGHEALEAMAHTSLGECLLRVGEYDEARDLIARAIAAYTRMDHGWELQRARYTMARLLQAVGEPTRAYEIHVEVLRSCRDYATTAPMAHVLRSMAGAKRELGELDESLALAEAALDAIEGRSSFVEADCLNELGRTHLAMGDPAAARDAHERAITVAERAGMVQERAEARHGLARAVAALGDPAKALGYATEAWEVLESIGVVEADELRRLVDELTASLAR